MGEHRVLVFLDGQPVNGSPFTVEVTSALVSSRNCITSGLHEAQAAMQNEGANSYNLETALNFPHMMASLPVYLTQYYLISVCISSQS